VSAWLVLLVDLVVDKEKDQVIADAVLAQTIRPNLLIGKDYLWGNIRL
jgi:hypothetical protein